MCKLVQRLLLLAAMLAVPWVTNAQSAQDYTFSTGVDSSKWVTLSTSATTISALTGEDDETSGCINIGFPFTFAGQSYTQFSCNTNGRLRLGSVACSYYWSMPFTTLSDASYNDLPFITALGMDVTFASTGSYAKYELVGTAPNRTLVVEYHTATTYDSDAEDLCTYQIQLLEGSNKVRLVYNTTDETYFDDFQIGIAATATDYLMVDPTTHAITNAGTSASYYTWPGVYRYYEFTPYIPSCPRVSSLVASNLTPTSADLTWTDGGNGTSWLIEYSNSTFTPGDGTATTVVATDTTYTLTSLTLGTTYYVFVRAICSGDSSTWMQLTFTTPASMPATVPYFCDFEDADNNGWDLVNGTQTNYWMVGTAAANGGTRGLYVTNDSSSNSYTNTSTSYVFATRLFNLNEAGEYGYSFDWKCNGESSYDFIRAAIVPANTEFTAGSYCGFNNSSAVPTGGIAIDGAQRLNLVTSWQTRTGTFVIATPGTYMMVFMWRNDGSAGTQPPAAIDNVMLVHNTCPQVLNLTASNVTSDSVTITWSAGSSETLWLVSDGSTVISTTDTTHTFAGLSPNTEYNFMVAPVCDGADTGLFASLNARTACGAMTVLPFTEDFESQPTGGSTNRNFISCWNRLNNGTSYYGYPYVSSTSSYNHTVGGTKGLYWYNSITTGTYGDYQCIVLPEVDTTFYPINTLQLTFWARATSTSYHPVLQVGVMTDPTDITTFQQVATVNVEGTVYDSYNVLLNRFAGSGAYVAIKAVRPSSSWYITMDDITLDLMPSCPHVSDLAATDVASNQVTLSWHENGTASEWLVRYYENDVLSEQMAYDTLFTLTGLTPNTEYEIMVAPLCGGSDTGLFSSVAVRTECGAFSTVPFVENFETATAGSSTSTTFVTCWHRLNNGTSYFGYPYVSSTSSYNHTPNGTKGLYWFNSITTGTYGDYQYVVLPAVDTDALALNTLRLSFWARSSSTSYYPVFHVGLMDDPTDVSTFHQVSTVNVGNSIDWRRYEVRFENYTGTGAYIAIRALRGSSSWYAYVDDIMVDLAPDCQAVTNIRLTNIDNSEATLTWTERGDAESWEIEYGYSGFTQGEGTTETVYSLPHSISSLSSGTAYDVYITPDCDGVGESDMISFTTDCDNLDSLPYTMGFETADGVAQTGTSTSNVFVDCWRRLNNGTQYFGYPYVNSSSTYNHTPGGSRGLYYYNTTTTGTYGDYMTVILPPFDTIDYPINTLRLSFWAKSSSASYHPEFQVGVMTNPLDNSTFRSCGTVAVSNLTDWYKYSVSLANYTGSGKYVALRSVRASSTWTCYVDDITLELQPDCPVVTQVSSYNITSNSATLRWTDRANTGSYTVEYGPYGFTLGTGSTESVSGQMVNLTGLSANTQYDVYITPDCSGTTDFAIYRFTTECEAMTDIPYTMGFETSDGVTSTGGSTSLTFVDCWHRLNNGSQYFGYPYVSSSSTYNHTPSGSRGLYWFNSTTTGTYGDYQYVVLPAVDGTIAINTLQLSFWAKASSSSYYPQFQVGVMTDPNNPNTFRQVGTVEVGNSTQWQEYTTVLGSYTGAGQYVAVRAIRGASWYAYVDDFTLDVAPSCPRVVNLDAPAVGTTGVQLTWQVISGYPSTPSQYEIEIIPTDTSESFSNIVVSANSYVITGLQPTHEYTFSVRGICDANDYGEWSDSLTIITSGMPCLVLDTASSFTANIGTGTSTSTYVPSYSLYNYGLSQQIYTASEIGDSGSITSIAIMPSAISQQRTFEIYMAHTSQSTLSGFIHPADMIRVYDGEPITLTANSWITFNLDTPFPYNGSDNLLICFRDMTGSYVSGNAWYGHSPSGTKAYYAYQDSGPYDPFTATGGTSSTIRNNIKIMAMTCEQQATCAAPTIIFDSSDYNYVTVSWIPGNDETSWDVEYRDADSTVWHNVGPVFTNYYTFTGVNPNREYEIRVTSLCTDSNYSSTITVRTPCYGDTLPFFTSFEDFPSSSISSPMPSSCWTRASSYSTSSGYPYASSSYAHGGSNAVYMYSTSTSYSYFALPRFAASLDSLRVEFWLLRSTSSYTNEIKVGVMTDPHDVSTFTEVATVTPPTDLYVWGHYEIYLDSYEGNGRNIAFMSPNGVTSYPYLDDLTVDYIPECRRIQDVEVLETTTTSALISWNMGEGMEFDVVCVPTGTDPDSGYVYNVFGEDTVTVTGLRHSTSYTVYVRGYCYPDTSQWSLGTVFRTECGLIDSVPFFDGFEAYSTGTSSTGSVFVPCWTRLNNGSSYGGYPYISNSSSYNHTPGGNKGFYWYNSTSGGSYGTYEYVILPEVDTNALPINTLQLSFWAKSSSTSYYPVLEVGIMEDNSDTTFHRLRTINLPNTTNWQEYVIPLGHYSGPGSYIAIRSLREFGSWYVYLDDVTLDTMPSCPMPLEIVFDSVGVGEIDIAWITSGSESAWEVTVNGPGFRGLDTIVYDTTLAVTGFEPAQVYTFGVRAICNSDDSSDFAYATIRTECITIDTLPYTQDFEGLGSYGSSASIFGVPCWDRITPGATSYYPYLSASTTYNHTPGGNTGLYWYGYNGGSYGSYQIIALPTIDTVALPINSLQLSFWVKASTNQPAIEVGVMSDGDGDSFVPVDTVIATSTSSWELFDVPLTNYTGRGNRIALRSIYNGTYWYGYVDDITVDFTPTCPHVGGLAVIDTTSGSLGISWIERGSANDYEVAIDTVNVIPTSPANIYSVYDTTGTTITGLTDGQYYYIWVRAICGSGDTSEWEGPVVGSPNSYYIRPNMVDTIYMCGGRIFDNGGPNGAYSHSQNSTLIIYPDAPNSLVEISGDFYMESCCDYIEIYDGAGTDGTMLYSTSGISSGTISSLLSESGPLTVYFHTDGSVAYDGFSLMVSCQSAYCRVTNMVLDTAYAQSDSRLALTWDSSDALYYEVEYGAPGFTLGTGTMLIANTNHVVISGLSALTNYEVYVRSICTATDTGAWAHRIFSTQMCGESSIAENWTSSSTPTTTNYGPIGYSCYNYSYTQIIIDSAQLASLSGDISGFGFKPSNSAAEYGSYYTGMDVYMANISESTFSSDFFHPDVNHQFVQVLSNGNCNFTSDNWQTIALDTTFVWDGHSNLLVAFNRSHGVYHCSAEFEGHTVSGNKMAYVYNDGSAYSVSTVSGAYLTNEVGDLRLISCGAVLNCDAPIISGTTTSYNSATINWTGDGSIYQVNVKEASATEWPATDITVTGTSHTFTGLQPSTSYTFRVRQDCTADTLGYSDWVTAAFVTDSLPCLTPDSLTVSNITNAGATFDWHVLAYETAWNIHVWNTGGLDSIYTVATHPASVGGFTSGVTYNAAVRPLCGSDHSIIGDWGDTITFTTQTCPNVTGLTTSNVTFNSVTLSWTAQTMAQSYRIEYGYHGFSQGTGTQVTVTTNTYTVTGLEDETGYDFYVKAICATGWESEQWANTTVTTATAPVTTYTITTAVNNSAYGSVIGGGVYAENSTATLTAVPNPGYHFTQWQDGNTSNPRTVTVTGNATYTAYFAADQYTVTATSSDATMGSVTGGGTYSYGTTATLTATANYGYHFTAWNDGNTDNPRTVTVTSDTALTAAFAANSYTVTVLSNDVTMGTVSGGGTYTYNSTATLTATALSGYNFRYWDDGNTSNPRLLTVTGDVTLTAVFSDDTSVVHNYTVTLSVNDPSMGSLTPAAGEYTYAEGTELTITASANSGYHFVSWSDNATDNPRTITVTGDIALRADFEANIDSTAVLTVGVNDVTMGHVTINGQAVTTYTGRLGDQVTLAAEAYDHYQFVNWSDGDINAQRTYTLTEANATLTANFRSLEGIDGVDGNVSCTIFPNPTSTSATVSVSGVNGVVRITVVDMNGRTVRSETLQCGGDCQKTMEVDGLAQGAYFVRITSETVNMVKKLVVR